MQQSIKPENIESLFQQLVQISQNSPKRLRRCAVYIAENPESVAVSTVAELAAAADVQPSALIRFCKLLGFSGFSEMQKLFRVSYVKSWPDYSSRLEKLRLKGDGNPGALLAEFADAGRASLEKLLHTVDNTSLEHAVQLLGKARIVHVAGYRRLFPVASYMAYAFEKMKVPCILHSNVGSLSSINMLSKEDVLIAISFSPYSNETVELVQAAKNCSMPVVAITDNVTSPLMHFNPVGLLVSEIDVGDFRTLTGVLSLAMTLVVHTGTVRDAR